MSSARQAVIQLISDITGTKAGQWLFARLAHRLDGAVMRLSRGQQTLAGLLTGLPVAFLTTTGAKSGLPRRVPVLLTFAGDKPLLISTNWGQRKYPGWHYNLSANPSAGLELNGQSGTYRARKVQGAERESYWALAVRQFPGYESYRSRVGGREIGVWLLEPVKDLPQSSQRTQREE